VEAKMKREMWMGAQCAVHDLFHVHVHVIHLLTLPLLSSLVKRLK
jgi:hypothetical protein